MRPLLAAALGVLFGTLSAVLFKAPAAWWLGGLTLALAAAAAFLNRRGAAILLAFFALTLTLTALRAMEPAETGRHALSGRVAETPQRSDSGWIVTLSDVSVDGNPRKQRLRLYLSGENAPAYGQRLALDAQLAAPSQKYASSYAYWGISCVAFSGAFTVTGESRDAYGALLRLRERVSGQIDLLFPDSGGVAAAMLLGDKSDVSEESLAAYRQSGAAHLMAVSGLHVTVLAGAWSLLFRRHGRLGFLLTAAFLIFYAALTAFSPSVLRAGLMLLCWQLSVFMGRPADRISALSLAFCVVLLINPYALFYAGFQLSFLAALGIALLAPMLCDRLRRLGPQPARLLSCSLSVWIATLPAQTLFFGSAPLLTLLSSLFMLPLAPFFLIPAFALTLLSFAGFPAANALAFLPRWALRIIDLLARLDTGWRLALPAPSTVSMLLYVAAILLLSRLCMRSRRRRTLYAGACFLGAALLWAL